MFAITGTPGVGKTTVAKILENRGYRVVDFITIAKYYGCVDESDEEIEVDLDLLKKLFRPDDFNFDFVEGHLSHCIANRCIVLRCRPDMLEERMRKKGWNEEKILENLEAEIIDYVLIEALETCREVHEIDTTFLSPEEVSNIVESIYKGRESFSPGNVDWIGELGDEVYRYLRL